MKGKSKMQANQISKLKITQLTEIINSSGNEYYHVSQNNLKTLVYIQIENNKPDYHFFMLCDSSGRQVLSESIKLNKTLIDLESSRSRQYTLAIYNENQTFISNKILINK